MGQTPSKRIPRTKSKDSDATDLSTKFSNRSSTYSQSSTQPLDVATPTKARSSSTNSASLGKKAGSVSSASGSVAISQASPVVSKAEELKPDATTPTATEGGLAVPQSPSIPTTQTILATSPNTLGSFKSSILGSSPPPPSSLPASTSNTSPPLSSSPYPTSPLSNQGGSGSSKDMASSPSTGGLTRTLDIDNMIGRLLEAGYSGKVTKSPPLKNAEIAAVCAAAREVFLSQPTLIELSPPVKIVGDVHGQVCTF
jgi:serine/threonine-protein phosphatase PP1 catalytic subunit